MVSGLVGLTAQCSWEKLTDLSRLLSWFLFRFWSHRRAVAVHNIRFALGLSERESLEFARRAFHHTVLTALEFIKMGQDPQGALERVSVSGLAESQRVLQEGRGLIIVTGHLGNFELMGAALAHYLPLWVIARPQSPLVWHLVRGIREKVGMRVIEKFGSLRTALSVLRRGQVLGILSDQHAGTDPGSTTVTFFGRKASVYTTPALLAARAQAGLVFGFSHRIKGGRHQVHLRPPLWVRPSQVEEVTRLFCQELEKEILKAPEQWWWLHDRWKGERMGLI